MCRVLCKQRTSIQKNVLIDEADLIGEGANVVINFPTKLFGECQGQFADNCIGQNKNNALMQYLNGALGRQEFADQTPFYDSWSHKIFV